MADEKATRGFAPLAVTLDGHDEPMPDRIAHGDILRAWYLPNFTVNGGAAVKLLIRLEDGVEVVGFTSAKLFEATAGAFRGRAAYEVEQRKRRN